MTDISYMCIGLSIIKNSLQTTKNIPSHGSDDVIKFYTDLDPLSLFVAHFGRRFKMRSEV